MSSKIFYTYHLIDPQNSRVFWVGKGKKRRMYNHESEVKRGNIPHGNRYLFNKINKIIKNGQSIVYKKILENVSEDESFKKEIEEIKKFGRKNNGTGILCNMTDGGEGFSGRVVSLEERKLMSIRGSGKNNPFYGKKHSIETRKKLSESHRGQRPWMLGKHHTEETIKKLKRISKNRFKNPEERKRISELTKFGMYKSGYVDRVSKFITLKSPIGRIITFKNISLFCRKYELENANIYKVLGRKIKHHRGWTLPEMPTISAEKRKLMDKGKRPKLASNNIY